MAQLAPRNSIAMHAYNLSRIDRECMDEIRRTLKRFQSDPAFRGDGQRVPLRQFARLAGVSRVTLYNVMRGDTTGLWFTTRDRILHAMALVVVGGLRWKRTTTKAVIEHRTVVPRTVQWIPMMPNGDPPPVMRRPQRGSDDHPNL